MERKPLPFDAELTEYEKQAEALLAAHGTGDPLALKIFHENHPRFLDEKITWLPKFIPDSEIQEAALDIEDARLALARSYSFRDWTALVEYVDAVQQGGSVFRFESAVEAVINGSLEALGSLLREEPKLIHARSTRICCFDPPAHRATLLHYIGANGVEGYRQKTPSNAVEVAKILLDAGAEVDATADMYGAPCTTMTMLVSSSHPHEAGSQVPLVETLLDYGAAIEGAGTDKWGTPLMTALIFGYPEAAKALAKRGARIDDVAPAAGLGRLEDAERLLPDADAESRHRALALAAMHGYAEIVRLLLDTGEDPDRYNPDGFHSHATPLHHAAVAGHEAVVRLMADRGASLSIKDTIYHGTPLGWAEHGGQTEIAQFLRERGAK